MIERTWNVREDIFRKKIIYHNFAFSYVWPYQFNHFAALLYYKRPISKELIDLSIVSHKVWVLNFQLNTNDISKRLTNSWKFHLRWVLMQMQCLLEWMTLLWNMYEYSYIGQKVNEFLVFLFGLFISKCFTFVFHSLLFFVVVCACCIIFFTFYCL